MENDRIAKRVYVGKCIGNRSVGRPRKMWIDPAKECLKKRYLDFKESRRMVYGWGLCLGIRGASPGMNH